MRRAVAATRQAISPRLAIKILSNMNVASEREKGSAMAERRVRARPMEAQSTAMSGDMASICNDGRARHGVDGGQGSFLLTLLAPSAACVSRRRTRFLRRH